MAKRKKPVVIPVREIDQKLIDGCCEIDLEKVQAALAEGANPNVVDRTEKHLIWHATDYFMAYQSKDERQKNKEERRKAQDILSVLLSSGTDPDGGISLSDIHQSTPLIEVCNQLEVRIAKLLLKYGADVNHIDDEWTWLDRVNNTRQGVEMDLEYEEDCWDVSHEELLDRLQRVEQMFKLAEAYDAKYYEDIIK